jgi:hypothetical protein
LSVIDFLEISLIAVLLYRTDLYRSRGSVARNHTNRKQNIHVFSPSTILCRLMNVSLMNSSGMLYPPKNRIAVSVDISTIEQYSPRKKNTKIIPLCSVKNPATSSDSASGRSNGVRFVSASAEMKKIMNIGSSGTTNQIASWLSIMLMMLNDPVSRITVRIAELRISSYEII